MKIGFVFAMDDEFEKTIGDRKPVKLSDEPFKVFSVGENFAVISGVGKINAAAGTTHLIEKYGVDNIINCGVCGATKNAFLRGEIAVIGAVVERDFDLSSAFGAEWKSPSIALDSGDPEAVLYTADVFTTTCENDGYFDMEGYAVARVAGIYGVKCSLIKSVTDIIDSGTQTEQFVCNFDRACELLRTELKKYI